MEEELSVEEWKSIAMFYRGKVNDLELRLLSQEVVGQRSENVIEQDVTLDQ